MNFWFLVAAISLTCFITWLVIYPPKLLAEFFEVIYLPHHVFDDVHLFRYSLLLFPLCHMIIAMFVEVLKSNFASFRFVIFFVSGGYCR